jgi:putrescine transport system ATP-binding protein
VLSAQQQLTDRPWLDPDATPQIVIESVTKTFGGFSAVDGVTLKIFKGEMFALVGASGCGKTTLLRMLAGFATPTGGRIMIEGVDMTAVPPHQRPVNMMFQSYALFPHMTVGENVGYGLRRLALARAVRSQRVQEALDMVQLGALAKRKPHQLSGGQRQRVEYPVAGRDHLRVRDARSGRGHGVVDAHRGHEPRPGGAGGHAVGDL